MGDNPKKPDDNLTPDSEELKQEDELLKDSTQDEIRSSVIEKYSLNEESQKDLIDGLVNDTLEQRKAMSKAIKQKRDWRSKAQEKSQVPDNDTTETSTSKPKPRQPKEDKGDISAKDAILLMKANVDNEEDIDEVARFAKFQNITIGAALQSKTMKTILAERQEERKTAEATHTGPSKKGSSKLTDAQIIENAAQGKFPEDPADLVRARNAQKYKK